MECVTKIKKDCDPREENICKTIYEVKCETKFKENCYEALRDIQKPYIENVCIDKDVAINCKKHWQCAESNVDLENCSDRIWVENPASCNYRKEFICEDVQKYRTGQESYQKCDKVPWDDCKDVSTRL